MVQDLIRRCFGVEYHVDYVGTLLHKLGWSVQKPTLRARERDEAAIARWRSARIRRPTPPGRASHAMGNPYTPG